MSISVTGSKFLGNGDGWMLAEHRALRKRCLCLTDHLEQIKAVRLGHHTWSLEQSIQVLGAQSGKPSASSKGSCEDCQ